METPAPKPSRLKKIFRRTLFVLATLVTLVALFVAEEDWRGSRAWRNYKSAMEAKGERFDAGRLIPPKVPDDENFAACPYLAHPFQKPPGSPGWTNIDSYLPTSYELPRRPGWPYGLSADLSNWAAAFQTESENSEPAERRRQIAQERPLRYGRLAATAENSQTRSPRGTASEKMDPAQAAAIVLDHLKVCEPVLAELRAASERRYCRFNVPYEAWTGPTQERAADSTLQHLEVFKGIFQVLALHASAELAAGRSDLALEDVNMMFRLEDGLKDEPLLISQLVSYSSAALLLKPIAEGLAERRWSDEQLRSLQERLGQTDLLASTVRAFYGELDILANPFFGSLIYVPRGWDRLEQLNLNRAFQEALLPRINLAEREINPTVGHACDLAMSNYPPSGAFIHHRFFAAMMLPTMFRAPEKAAAVQTDVDLIRVACALERYRLAEGNYPDQLASLSPRFIATLPHDIINGQPLKYRRTANGKFVLYSVGWNEKDDGGVVATKKDGSPDRNHGDWVLEYPD
jgi:hypothetical protein